MAWVRFTEPFDWSPRERPTVTIAFPPGVFNVRRDCADRAVKARKAVRVKAPKRGEDARSGESEGPGPVRAANDD